MVLYTHQAHPTIEWSNIAETFEENGPPILAFANTETFDGTSTEPLLSLYEQVVNGASAEVRGSRKLAMKRYNSNGPIFMNNSEEEEEESEEAVLLYTADYEISSTLTVEEAMEEAAEYMHELAEEAEEGELHFTTHASNSEEAEGEHMEAFAGYYIYNMDEINNQYSIGVYGNQVAAASTGAFGATMLQTLA